MSIHEKLESINLFIKDFINYIDSELYVKLHVILFHYEVIPQAKSYMALENFKKALEQNGDYQKYIKLINDLETSFYSPTSSTHPQKIKAKLKELPTYSQAKHLSDNTIEYAIEPYLTDNKRIYRLINNFLDAESISQFIGTRNLVKTFIHAFPAPCTVGLYYYKWSPKTMYKFMNLYFPTAKHCPTIYSIDYALQKEYSNVPDALTDILKFYNSPKEKFSFYYLYYKQFDFNERNNSKRLDRQYSQYFAMYIIDLDFVSIKFHAITTPLITENEDYPNLEYFFNIAYQKIIDFQKQASEEISTPVFFLNTKLIDNYIRLYSNEVKMMPPYQLIFFKNQKKLISSMSHLINSIDFISPLCDYGDILRNIFEIETDIEAKIKTEIEKLHKKTNCQEYSSKSIHTLTNKISSTWKTSLDKLYRPKKKKKAK